MRGESHSGGDTNGKKTSPSLQPHIFSVSNSKCPLSFMRQHALICALQNAAKCLDLKQQLSHTAPILVGIPHYLSIDPLIHQRRTIFRFPVNGILGSLMDSVKDCYSRRQFATVFPHPRITTCTHSFEYTHAGSWITHKHCLLNLSRASKRESTY